MLYVSGIRQTQTHTQKKSNIVEMKICLFVIYGIIRGRNGQKAKAHKSLIISLGHHQIKEDCAAAAARHADDAQMNGNQSTV